MEPDQNNNIENGTPISKVVAGIIGISIVASGGTYVLTQSHVNLLENRIILEINQKQEILKDYLYSQISTNRIPVIDLNDVSNEELLQAFIGVYVSKGGNEENIKSRIAAGEDINMMTEIKSLASNVGELLECK